MMDFLNDSVNLDQLPHVERIELKKISPDYLKVLRIELAITSFIALMIATVIVIFVDNLQTPLWISVIAGGWFLLGLLQFFIQQKSFEATGFVIRDHDMVYQSGWLIRKLRTCPFNRVQHSSVSSGPLERKFHLATLILYTAGSDASDLRISGLHESEAVMLKEWINKKVVDEQPV